MTGNVWVSVPLIVLAGGACAVTLLARLVRRNGLLAGFTALTFALALAAWAPLFAAGRTAWRTPDLLTWGSPMPNGASLRADPGGLLMMGMAIGLGLIVSVFSGCYLALDRRYETYYPLLLLLVTGLGGMVLASDLFSLYLFCELTSIAAYVLVAFRRSTDTAIEAGFKYLVMGSVGSIAILMGISFIYREAGSLALPVRSAPGVWTRIGAACFLVGMGIKSAIVPLHAWLPDAHGRAPSSISAMLSGVVIQSAFYVWVKVGLALGLPATVLGACLIVLSLSNMTLGNCLALVQTHTKRLLAYSTIAQMGYVMFGIGIGLRFNRPAAIQAGLFLLWAHAVMKSLAFMGKGVCHFYCAATTVAELRGTALRLPLVAVATSVSLAGLAAVPPLAGFAGKWFVLAHAISVANPLVYVGVAVFLLNSLLALGYYLPLIAILYAPLLGPRNQRIAISSWMAAPLIVLGGLVIAMGLAPGPWMSGMTGVGDYLLSLGE